LLKELFWCAVRGFKDLHCKFLRNLARGLWCESLNEDDSADPKQSLPQALRDHTGANDGDALGKKKLFDLARPRGVRDNQKNSVSLLR
jgi:hypothetical protein